jgi:hypothetical protein
MTLTISRTRIAIVLAAAALTMSCGGNADEPYKASPAWSGKKASLPAPPTLPNTPVKAGDAYTVFGATHHLRSLVHNKDVTKDPITITGYIVDTNIGRAPDCAVHPSGKKDKDEDKCNAEVPSFWIADTKGDKSGTKIRVVGWARNYAIIYDAIKKWGDRKLNDPPKDKDVIHDDILNVDVPFPLPAVGAKVKVTGKYGVSTRQSSDLVADPMNGVILQTKIETTEEAPEKAAFAKKI